ncbi:MAG: hypothetical protein PHX87_03465 [Candidatus Peribacteraceae bacterium]|nr:hypothetical protein [Candidatus Peribacteraceae bacterium]MDD5742465.1 hypothetical protein [Candidatus Peribacteraceae bacterium]
MRSNRSYINLLLQDECQHADDDELRVIVRGRRIGDGRAVDREELQILQPLPDREEGIAVFAVRPAGGGRCGAVAGMPVRAIIPVVARLLVASRRIIIFDSVSAVSRCAIRAVLHAKVVVAVADAVRIIRCAGVADIAIGRKHEGVVGTAAARNVP